MQLLLLLLLSFVGVSVGKQIHVVFSNHVDIGFDGIGAELGYDNNVFNKYFDEHFPRAIELASWARSNKTYPFMWTTQPYLLSMFLDCPASVGLHCPNSTAVAALEAAIQRGDITWHAMPHNAQVEVFDPPLLKTAISIARKLDAKYGRPAKTTMSQRDVPGLTRAAIPILAGAGVQALSVGVNKGSAPPAVPPCQPFIWKDAPSNTSIVAFWHPGGYGGKYGYLAVDSKEDCISAPGLDHVLCVAWRGDNSGPPQNTTEIQWVYQHLQQEFPGDDIFASTFEAFTEQLVAALPRLNLPEVTDEIGDSWIYGIASDPAKLADFRTVLRLRRACLDDGRCSEEDAKFQEFSRLLVKIPEHTWGLDTKQGLHDFWNWTNDYLHSCLEQHCPNYIAMATSWRRQYSYIPWAVEALAERHPIKEAFLQERALRHQGLDAGLKTRLLAGRVLYSRLRSPSSAGTVAASSADWELEINTTTGALTRLQRKWQQADGSVSLGADWGGGPDSALLQMVYSTFTEASFDVVWKRYKYLPDLPVWFHADFGKPNVSRAEPVAADMPAALEEAVDMSHQDPDGGLHLALRLTFPGWAVQLAGAPASMWVLLKSPTGIQSPMHCVQGASNEDGSGGVMGGRWVRVAGWVGRGWERMGRRLGLQRVWRQLMGAMAGVRREQGAASHASSRCRCHAGGKMTGGRPCTEAERGQVEEAGGKLQVELLWIDKTATRLPEALWLRLRPGSGAAVEPGSWRLNKLGSWISPLEVIKNGSQSLHAVQDDGVLVDSTAPAAPQQSAGCQHHSHPCDSPERHSHASGRQQSTDCAEQHLAKRSRSKQLPAGTSGALRGPVRERLQVRSLDAALVSVGKPSAFPIVDERPDMRDGVAFNLVNNIWGTNYVMWFPYEPQQATMRFRFQLEVSQG